MRELELAEVENVSGAGVTSTTEPLPGGGTRVVGRIIPNDSLASISSELMNMSGAGSWGEYFGAQALLTGGNDGLGGAIIDGVIEEIADAIHDALSEEEPDSSDVNVNVTVEVNTPQELEYVGDGGWIDSNGNLVIDLNGDGQLDAAITQNGVVIIDDDYYNDLLGQ